MPESIKPETYTLEKNGEQHLCFKHKAKEMVESGGYTDPAGVFKSAAKSGPKLTQGAPKTASAENVKAAGQGGNKGQTDPSSK